MSRSGYWFLHPSAESQLPVGQETFTRKEAAEFAEHFAKYFGAIEESRQPSRNIINALKLANEWAAKYPLSELDRKPDFTAAAEVYEATSLALAEVEESRQPSDACSYDVTHPAPRLYKSDCGKYLCRAVGCWGNFEAWSEDGCIHWRNDNRNRTWADAARYRRPLVYSVGAYSAEKTGQKPGSFTLSLMHCDVMKEIDPLKGNTILKSFEVIFRRKIPPQNIPRWFKNQEIANV